MMARQLSENTVKHLAVPAKGNRIHYFAGHTVQGQTAPRGFGVRVTAGGSKVFVLNYRVAGRERRFTIGEWKDAGGGCLRFTKDVHYKFGAEGPPGQRHLAKVGGYASKMVPASSWRIFSQAAVEHCE